MATVAVDHQGSHQWGPFPSHPHHPFQPPGFQSNSPPAIPTPPPQTQPYAAVANPYSSSPPIRPRNDVEFTRDKLITILEHFSQLLPTSFGSRPLRFVVHGGACMLLHPMMYNLSFQQHQLHPTLPHRTTTRDVDYIQRSFIIEMNQLGMTNAAAKLKECILATARHFNLGADWMNSDADIALPMATAPNGMTYDPIYYASVQPNNIDLHTIFCSRNGMLTLISVTPFWAVSLKLVRYLPNDAADICLLLKNGTNLSGTKWTVETLREWLFGNCWAMGYSSYDAKRLQQLNLRLKHAIQMVTEWGSHGSNSGSNSLLQESSWSSVNVSFTPPHQRQVTAIAAMGGGEVVGGEHGSHGWKSTFNDSLWALHPNGGNNIRSNGFDSTPPQHPPGSSPPVIPNEPNWGERDSPDHRPPFIPPTQYAHDPHDFSLVSSSHADAAAAAARKARKRARADRQSIQSPSPPTPPQSTSQLTTPWHRYSPGQHPQDSQQRQSGLSNMQDLERSLSEMLAYPQQLSYYPYATAGPSIHIPVIPSMVNLDQSKKTKKKSKDKKKSQKEKERKKERERERQSKRALPRDSFYTYEQEAADGEATDTDSDVEEDNRNSYTDSHASDRQRQVEPASSWYAAPPTNQNPPYPNQHNLAQSQSFNQSYQPPRSSAPASRQAPFVPPLPPPEKDTDRQRPSPLDISPTPRPMGLPPSHFVPFQGRPPQASGQAPATMTMPVPQISSVPLIPPFLPSQPHAHHSSRQSVPPSVYPYNNSQQPQQQQPQQQQPQDVPFIPPPAYSYQQQQQHPSQFRHPQQHQQNNTLGLF